MIIGNDSKFEEAKKFGCVKNYEWLLFTRKMGG